MPRCRRGGGLRRDGRRLMRHGSSSGRRMASATVVTARREPNKRSVGRAQLLQTSETDDEARDAISDRGGGIGAARQDRVAATAQRVLAEHERLPAEHVIDVWWRLGRTRSRSVTACRARDRMAIGDDIANETERVTEHVADEIRHRDAEILRALAQLGLETLGNAGVDHALLLLGAI